MLTTDFIHLRVHSAYSLAEGAIKLKDLIPLCQQNDMPAVAVTDTNNLFGAMEFSLAAAKSGVQPIIGCQLAIARPEWEAKDDISSLEDPDQLLFLVQNELGYKNLVKLVSKAHIESDDQSLPHIEWNDLEKYNEGIICLTAGPKGTIGRLLSEGQVPKAKEVLIKLKNIFDDRLYIELLRHGTADETQIEDHLISFAYEYEVALVATNNCYFSDREMHEAHDALLCIAGGNYVIEENRKKVTPEHYFKSQGEMKEIFKDIPEAIENTVIISQRCSYLLQPIDPLLPPCENDAGRTEEEEIRYLSEEGLKWRLDNFVYTDDMSNEKKEELSKEYFERLEYELDVITKMGFSGYFLIVTDFIQWSKDNDIPVGPGRGSGAGSVVAWSLKVTDLDPIRFNLLFERFLNPERVSMPDFDIDFCQDRREEVISYVQDKYGYDHVAQIITFGKLQAKAVIRDVGRVLQMPYGQVDKIAKLIPGNAANPMSLPEALDEEPLLREARDTNEAVAKLINIALKLEGLYRHASTHAAGVVIGDRPLNELVPLYRDPRSDMPVTQFNMKYVEQTGLVKFDFLGLKTLTVIHQAVKNIEEQTGEKLDPLYFPLDDKKTFEMLEKGKCAAVFQMESAGMQDLCKQMHVSKFEEMIAIVALYRPGPMENIPKYLACLKGDEEQEYLHEDMKPILEETYGVMIYQEQVMQVAQSLAKYTLGGADILRKAMGKKIKEEMDAQHSVFVKGAVANDIDEELAGDIFEQMAKFASYGFNKAHSAAYGYVAYQTAYLKANYPEEFMAATMTLDMGNTDKLGFFRQELQKMDIKLLLPDVNKSGKDFNVEIMEDGAKSIRYALAALKGVGEQAIEAIERERDKNGIYKDLYDLVKRFDTKTINKRQMEAMASAGAFDGLNSNRAQNRASAEILLKYAATLQNEKESGQESLFGGEDVKLEAPELPVVEDWEPLEALRKEFDAVGFYLSAHPLDSMQTQLERLRITDSKDVSKKLSTSPNTRLRMAGIVMKKQERVSAKGNRFAFVQLSDAYGVYEVMMFSEVLAQSRDLLEAGTSVLVTVDADKKSEDEIRFLAQRVEPLDALAARTTEVVHIILSSPRGLESIKNSLVKYGQGKVKVSFIIKIDQNRETIIELPGNWNIASDTCQSLCSLDGVEEVKSY